jgi:hypothetical protein
MSPERVLDTRDGSGVPGAPIGPIASGQAVVLSLAGQHGIPSYAVGFVGTLSVLEATYNGFASVRPDDRGGDVIAGYFTDRGDPTAFTIVAGLSSEGAVSISLSDNWPGSAQLLLDVSAYLG